MRKHFLLLPVELLLLWFCSCTSPNPAYCESDSDCRDPRFPACDTSIHGCVGLRHEEAAGDNGGLAGDDGGLPGDDGGLAGDDGGLAGDDGGGDHNFPDSGDHGHDILYVDDDACPGPGSGTAENPYCSIQDAVDAARDGGRTVLVQPGTYQQDLRINGDVEIQGSGGGVTIETGTCPGILVMNRASVVLDRLTITGEGGIRVTAGSHATITRCRVTETRCLGIDCQDSTCVVLRSQIMTNEQGGINLSSSTYTVANNIIAKNGQSGAFGGLQIRAAGPGSSCLFNTITANQASGMNPAGISCLTAAVIENSIVWENGEGGTNQVNGPCTLNYCDVGGDTGNLDGSNNLSQEPRFSDPENDDYHILPDSPCIDRADPASSISDDIDGQPRPQGQGPDVGADEAR